jgi:hypothetical protein
MPKETQLYRIQATYAVAETVLDMPTVHDLMTGRGGPRPPELKHPNFGARDIVVYTLNKGVPHISFHIEPQGEDVSYSQMIGAGEVGKERVEDFLANAHEIPLHDLDGHELPKFEWCERWFDSDGLARKKPGKRRMNHWSTLLTAMGYETGSPNLIVFTESPLHVKGLLEDKPDNVLVRYASVNPTLTRVNLYKEADDIMIWQGSLKPGQSPEKLTEQGIDFIAGHVPLEVMAHAYRLVSDQGNAGLVHQAMRGVKSDIITENFAAYAAMTEYLARDVQQRPGGAELGKTLEAVAAEFHRWREEQGSEDKKAHQEERNSTAVNFHQGCQDRIKAQEEGREEKSTSVTPS